MVWLGGYGCRPPAHLARVGSSAEEAHAPWMAILPQLRLASRPVGLLAAAVRGIPPLTPPLGHQDHFELDDRAELVAIIAQLAQSIARPDTKPDAVSTAEMDSCTASDGYSRRKSRSSACQSRASYCEGCPSPIHDACQAQDGAGASASGDQGRIRG